MISNVILIDIRGFPTVPTNRITHTNVTVYM